MSSWGSPAPGYDIRSPGNQYQNARTTSPRFPQHSPNFRQSCVGPQRGRVNSGFSPVQNQRANFHPYQQDFFKSPTSPQHRQFTPNGPNLFRHPPPVTWASSPSSMSWGDRSHPRPSQKRLQMQNMKSPRYDYNCNPGGSNNIESYYHTSMLDDPWRDLTPVPVTHSPSTTT